MGDMELGKCQFCGNEGPIRRKYFHYNINCECHSPNHFEIVYHCNNCEPREPREIKVILSTEKLKNSVIKFNKLL